MIKFLKENFTAGAIWVFSIAMVVGILLMSQHKKPMVYSTGVDVEWIDGDHCRVLVKLWSNYMCEVNISPKVLMETMAINNYQSKISLNGKDLGELKMYVSYDDVKTTMKRLEAEQGGKQ